MSSDLRILVVGDVNGHFKALYKKVKGVLKKNGQFDALFVAGSFFGTTAPTVAGVSDDDKALWAQFKDKKTAVPIATYILGPMCVEQQAMYDAVPLGGDILPGITFIGKSGVHVLANGLRVGSLNGVFDPATFAALPSQDGSDVRGYVYTEADVKAIAAIAQKPDFKGVDILLTPRWPDFVRRGSKVLPETQRTPQQNKGATELAKILKPRYHFSSGQAVFFEREPYRNHKSNEAATNVTRFLGLAPVGNEKKEKWIYAFSICPRVKCDKAVLFDAPKGTTESPYWRREERMESRQAESMQMGLHFGGGAYNAYSDPRNRHKRGQNASERPNKRPFKPRAAITSQKCWFCLSNESVEQHLVVSVGDEMYLSLPKGPLADMHILILPIQHIPSTVKLSRDALAEMNLYKDTLTALFAQQGFKLIAYERNHLSDHMQLQVIPVPKAISDAAIEATFKQEGAKLGLNVVDFKSYDRAKSQYEFKSYFMLMLSDGRVLACNINDKFPINFGRRILCHPSILNTPSREDWKRCQLGKEREEKEAAAFRRIFEGIDPMKDRS